MPQPSAWMRSASCWLCGQLVLGGAGHVEDLAAQGQHGLGLAVARLLGGAAGRVAFDDEELGAFLLARRAIGELAGQPELAHRGLAADFLFLAPADALLGAVDDEVRAGGRPGPGGR